VALQQINSTPRREGAENFTPSSDEDDLITLLAAAEKLGISRPKMSRLVHEELFPIYTRPLDRRKKYVRIREVQAAVQYQTGGVTQSLR